MADRRRWRRAVVPVCAVAVVAGATGTAYAALGRSGPHYRLATATVADVTSTLHVIGTVTPVDQASLGFPVSGTVASVAVKPGQHVRAGQLLASLDATQLAARVTSAEQGIANANLTVADDETSRDAATIATTVGSAPHQQNSTGAEHALDRALAQVSSDLTLAAAVCSSPPSAPVETTPPAVTSAPIATSTPGTTGTPTATDSPSLEPTDASSTSAPTPHTRAPHPGFSPKPPLQTCSMAQQKLVADRAAISKAEQQLRRQVIVPAATREPATRQTTPVSDVQLAADRAAVTAAEAQLAVARQDEGMARLVAPADGTIIAVDTSVGAAASPRTTAFVIAGGNSDDIVANVDVGQLPKLSIGQSATVSVDGTDATLAGSVAAIALLPTTDSTGSSSYPATIALPHATANLRAGAAADVTIVVQRAHGTAVPTSAVRALGAAGVVSVFGQGKVQPTRVTLGVRGPDLTQILSGLRPGQQVVLADLTAALPTATTSGRLGAGIGAGLGGTTIGRSTTGRFGARG